MPTQEEVERKQTEVEDLRKKVNEAEGSNEQSADERTREIKAQRLDDEKRRLEARLAQATERDERNKKKAKESEGGTSASTSTESTATPPPSASTARPTPTTPSSKGTSDNDDKE